MIGWLLFSDVDPAHWRDIGRALLTMFQLVTVEGWYEIQDAALASEPWAWIYFVSFVIISAFVLFNMVIGVVINSMEGARDQANAEAEAARRAELAASSDPSIELVKRLDALQEAMTDLRAQLETTPDDRSEATPAAPDASPSPGTDTTTRPAR
jgi:voltage-gated sodium channel